MSEMRLALRVNHRTNRNKSGFNFWCIKLIAKHHLTNDKKDARRYKNLCASVVKTELNNVLSYAALIASRSAFAAAAGSSAP